ncbi:MAG: AzlC family ABC transporter permease [Treponema sp.]|nr:AzlC family ABC transporter permease [Treponema sp.]
MNKAIAREAASHTTPIFFGYMAIGIPLGLMVVNAGYPWWLSLVMGLFMYSGAGEYVAIGLFAAGASLAEIAITEFFVNIRHIVYGLSLIEKCRGTRRWKPFIIYWLTDETYALLCSTEIPARAEKGPFLGTIAFLDFFYWVLGSVIGALACNVLQHFNLAQYLNGVDFALSALFAVILCGQIGGGILEAKKAGKAGTAKSILEPFVPVAIGIATCVLAVLLFKVGLVPSSNIIFLSILMGIALIVIFRGIAFYSEREQSAKTAILIALSAMILAGIVFAAGLFQIKTSGSVDSAIKEKLPLALVIVAIFICGAIIFFERSFSFLLFSRKEPPPLIKFIEKYIPSMIIAILLVYCFKDINFALFPYGLPAFAGLAFALVVNLLVKNSMVSIFGATALYMILSAFLV